uniref:3'-5' exonuclease domain-containing protein n=1 Tax=Caenorhabditis tropicalis TaxID=1561998 RepID=A0A1I7T8W1_9PELO
MSMGGHFPVYIDTESTRFPSEGTSKLALITICDVDSQIILLSRVQNSFFKKHSEIKRILQSLGGHRRIATYGCEEELFEPDQDVLNLQQTTGIFGDRESLKNAVLELRFNLIKTETMSNWTNKHLRRDQIAYAAMDALILHRVYIHIFGYYADCWTVQFMSRHQKNKKSFESKDNKEQKEPEWTLGYAFLRWFYLACVIFYSITSVILTIILFNSMANLTEDTSPENDFQ